MSKLFILLALSLTTACIGPFKELDRQIDDVYLSSPLDGTPEPLSENFVNKVKTEELWSLDFPEFSNNSEPVFTEKNIFIISSNGKFIKINLENGVVEFSKELGVNVSLGLIKSQDEESFFFIDAENYLTKLNSNAEIQWRIRLSKKVDLIPYLFKNQIIVKYKNSDIESFDIFTSESLWSYHRINPPLSISLQSPIIISDNLLYTGYPGGKIIIIDAETGAFLTELTVSRPSGVTEIDKANDISGDIAIIDSLLLAASFNGELTAFDRSSGQKVWGRKVSSYFGVKTDKVNLILVHEDDAIYNFDRNTGKTLWKANFMKYRKASRPVIFRDYVLTTDYLGILNIISLNEGELLGVYEFNNEPVYEGVNLTKIFNNDSSFFVITNNSSIHKLSISNE